MGFALGRVHAPLRLGRMLRLVFVFEQPQVRHRGGHNISQEFQHPLGLFERTERRARSVDGAWRLSERRSHGPDSLSRPCPVNSLNCSCKNPGGHRATKDVMP